MGHLRTCTWQSTLRYHSSDGSILSLLTSVAQKVVGRKRAREDSAEDTAAELGLSLPDSQRKKARTGWAGTQWITVYVKRRPMKQRCALLTVDLCTS